VRVLNSTSAHKRPFSAIQWLKAKLGVGDTYREIKMWLNQGCLAMIKDK